MRYCEAIFQTKRWRTREVFVGSVGIGGAHPIRIQSMTTSDTRDVTATVEQIMRLADEGCEIARVTVQGMKEAFACEQIKERLLQGGYTIPLVADIHFYPPAALQVAQFVDKVRINPGNYLDKRATFQVLHYDDASYAEELERIEERFTPLVETCKRLKRAMRIGTNHGSLSDRIMNRYGDTPRGMVESALEFARVCRRLDYHDFLFSMKASNPQVMILAYRLLVAEMQKLGWNYPLHLGVTEAGEGEDGRVKSAMGIGALLLDGLGDTIRVSLTEDPWQEIDPCRRLIRFAEESANKGIAPFQETGRNITDLTRRALSLPQREPWHRDGSVFLSREELGPALEISGGGPKEWEALLPLKSDALLLTFPQERLHRSRHFFEWLHRKNLPIPVILGFSYNCSPEDLVIRASAECGSLLADRLGEGLFLQGPYPQDLLKSLSFSILQSARMRFVKTDFISCPSCGRTLFNLQEVTKQIHALTSHLPGVKIAIMGCIVNGPGEMADADFGYVGSARGKIDLYVGKECVERNIESALAGQRLVDLIKQHGRWTDPIQH